MPNLMYNQGVRKERRLVNSAKEQGNIAFRSAGSHSPIDVCIIDPVAEQVWFIQCKPDSMSEAEKGKIRAALPKDGMYQVYFEVV